MQIDDEDYDNGENGSGDYSYSMTNTMSKEMTDCDIGSCSCRVVSMQCFPTPDPDYPIYDYYGGEDNNQCRADTKDCEIQPDQRSDEKTWA